MIPNTIAPATWLGGAAADYTVKVLSNGGWGTVHKLTGKVLPHVMATVGHAAFDAGPVGTLLNGANLAVGVKALSVAKTTLGIAQAGLAVSSAGLAVGLLGLGVGVWNAWNIHETRKTVERVEIELRDLSAQVGDLRQASWRVEQYLHWQTQHLEHLLSYNSAMLGIILENQGLLANGLDTLRQQLHLGFTDLSQLLHNVESRREARELRTQMQAVHSYYSLCSKELAAGRLPPKQDLRSIVDRSVGLRAWLEARLIEHPVGAAERLPYLVGQALALRQETDARHILNQAPNARDDERASLQRQVELEIRAALQAPLFERATQTNAMIEHYIYLRRALSKTPPATLVEFADNNVVPYYPRSSVLWDDRLAPVRDIAGSAPQGSPEHFELRSLRAQQAWARLGGVARGQRHLAPEEVYAVLGTNALSEAGWKRVIDFADVGLQESEKIFAEELDHD